MSLFNRVVCLACGGEMPPDASLAVCSRCGSPWLDARYDYQAAAEQWPAVLQSREHTLWRYAELLPLPGPDPEIHMGEGGTPLVRLHTYERDFDHGALYLKDERQGPTGSFKDRQAALAVTAMRQAGITECVLASTGNAGAAYAAYCARAGIRLWLFLTSSVSSEKMREAALYGAEVVKVSGTYDETKQVAADFASRKGILFDQGAKAIPGKESMKTLAYEIAEQLGQQRHGGARWAAPDWYIQAVSGGIGPLGVWKGFQELYQMGLIDRLPKLGIIQAAGCAPMARAFAAGLTQAPPVVPRTLITVLATGDPGPAYEQLRTAVLSQGGTMRAVEDGQAFEAMRRLASQAGYSMEPAAAVAFAGLEQLLLDGTIQPDEVVVVNGSGHTFTAESHILGDRYVHELSLGESPREGLGRAIEQLDEQVSTVLVVDDNATDRRLIKRLLGRHKRYRVLEAADGREALAVLAQQRADLIVTDLSMPEMDGFTLLEWLRADPQTAAIPVIVASARTITAEDHERLDPYTQTIWAKGGGNTSALVESVVAALGHAGQPDAPASPTEAASSPAETGTLAGIKILIIEDDPLESRLARRVLEHGGGFVVMEADSGRAGLKAVYEHRPDLVILDLMLPELTGFDILRALHDDPALADIPVIVVSAKSLTLAEHRLLQTQSVQFFEKGAFDRKEFLYVVRDALK